MHLHTIKTPTLKLAYELDGPKSGEPILLLHGWPDSPRTWDNILPALHAAGYRTIAPYLRGYGPTEFRSPLLGRKPRRTGQPVAFAQDAIDLLDALKLPAVHVIGHDWGARTAYALAALFPQRLHRMATLAVPFHPGPLVVPSLAQAQAYWYQWFLCTQPGEKTFQANPIAFARRMWDTWSRPGWYTPEAFAETAKSWQNPDFTAVAIHSYRVRWGHAPQDPAYAVLQTRYDSTQTLGTPTLALHGLQDACALAETTDGAGRHFTNGYRRVLVDGAGHFPQREQPEAVAAEILKHLRAEA